MEILNGGSRKKVVEGLSSKDILLSAIDAYYLKEFTNDRILRLSVTKVENEAMTAGLSALIHEIERSSYDGSGGIFL